MRGGREVDGRKTEEKLELLKSGWENNEIERTANRR